MKVRKAAESFRSGSTVRFYRTVFFNLESKIKKTISEAKSNLQQKSEKRKKPIKLEVEHQNRFWVEPLQNRFRLLPWPAACRTAAPGSSRAAAGSPAPAWPWSWWGTGWASGSRTGSYWWGTWAGCWATRRTRRAPRPRRSPAAGSGTPPWLHLDPGGGGSPADPQEGFSSLRSGSALRGRRRGGGRSGRNRSHSGDFTAAGGRGSRSPEPGARSSEPGARSSSTGAKLLTSTEKLPRNSELLLLLWFLKTPKPLRKQIWWFDKTLIKLLSNTAA